MPRSPKAKGSTRAVQAVQAVDPVRRVAAAFIDQRLDARCREMIAQLQRQCPELMLDNPPPPGQVAAVLPVDPRATRALIVAAATAAVGAPVTRDQPAPVVWVDGDSELLVNVARIDVALGSGLVTVSIPVRCDQTQDATVGVTFAVGSADRPAGLLAATHGRPTGPDAVVDRWGEALTALAWQALVTAATGLSATSGVDADGAGLVPAGIVASPDGLEVHTMARPRIATRTRP